MLTGFDLCVLALLAIAPFWSRAHYRRFLARRRSGVVGARRRIYRETIAFEYLILAAAGLAWWRAGRSAEELGLAVGSGWRIGAGLALLGLLLGLCGWQWSKLQRLDAAGLDREREELRTQLGVLEEFLPGTSTELATWAHLSFIAGISEELVFRGYLMGLVMAAGGGPWLAVLGSSLVFAVAHSYQGLAGVVRVFAVGLAMAGIYLLTGSLWVPMAIHFVGDLYQGWATRRLLGGSEPPVDGDGSAGRSARTELGISPSVGLPDVPGPG